MKNLICVCVDVNYVNVGNVFACLFVRLLDLFVCFIQLKMLPTSDAASISLTHDGILSYARM